MATSSNVGATDVNGAENENNPENPTSQANLILRIGGAEVVSSASGPQTAILAVVVAILAIVVTPAITTHFLSASWSGWAMGGVIMSQLALEFTLGWLIYKHSLNSK